MSDMEVHAFEDAAGAPHAFTTTDAAEAREYAQRNGLRWLAHGYEFVGTDLVQDFTDPEEGGAEQ